MKSLNEINHKTRLKFEYTKPMWTGRDTYDLIEAIFREYKKDLEQELKAEKEKLQKENKGLTLNVNAEKNRGKIEFIKELLNSNEKVDISSEDMG